MKYLFNENPLVIDRELATVIGLNEAIILQQMQYWIKKSEHSYDNKTWIYNSVSQWKKQFPFFSESTIGRTIKSLEEKDFLFIGNFNKDKRDRTRWYSINYKKLYEVMKNAISQNDECNKSKCSNAISQNDECNKSKCSNAISQNDKMQQVKSTSPLPENTTENTTNIIKSSSDELPKSKKTDSIDFDMVLKAFNDAVEDKLPKIQKMTTARKNAVKKLLKEFEQPTFQNLANYFYDFVEQAKPFYFGENDRNWRADFDYIVKPNTHLKFVEGRL